MYADPVPHPHGLQPSHQSNAAFLQRLSQEVSVRIFPTLSNEVCLVAKPRGRGGLVRALPARKEVELRGRDRLPWSGKAVDLKNKVRVCGPHDHQRLHLQRGRVFKTIKRTVATAQAPDGTKERVTS